MTDRDYELGAIDEVTALVRDGKEPSDSVIERCEEVAQTILEIETETGLIRFRLPDDHANRLALHMFWDIGDGNDGKNWGEYEA